MRGNIVSKTNYGLAPFGQPVEALMHEKQISFDRVEIDVKNAKPKWLEDASPMGYVPLLKVGDDFLFESQVMMEYLDETFPPGTSIE